MARKLRLEYAGTCYHVINRGNCRSDVFGSAGAADAFEVRLGEAAKRYGWRGVSTRANRPAFANTSSAPARRRRPHSGISNSIVKNQDMTPYEFSIKLYQNGLVADRTHGVAAALMTDQTEISVVVIKGAGTSSTGVSPAALPFRN